MKTVLTGSNSSAVLGLGLKELRIAPHTPWQSPYVERLIGSLRRECLDHVIVFSPTHLRGVLDDYLGCSHRSRTHLGLDKGAPEPRPVLGPEANRIVAVPQVGSRHSHGFYRHSHPSTVARLMFGAQFQPLTERSST